MFAIGLAAAFAKSAAAADGAAEFIVSFCAVNFQEVKTNRTEKKINIIKLLFLFMMIWLIFKLSIYLFAMMIILIFFDQHVH